ncbi:DUF2635 domain-containing protein [Chromobacterium violaceum]|uniref:DUF2635 domain-containing protein n=2 Tax=Chromobacterium violaceum TaxID=536 RepID=A0AAX2MAM9_CHRVL|nr:DUF2635 domain-containing protein [Chromobacterium violaceum]MBX9268751.1 DUF2635 domain-containing protein [Chromobacterium violaceum]OLZ71829.1 hypothetical protein BS642_20900 [Chromobacterium violaceum]STB70915.1 Uncharacterised protein [Chromobacterium violaceum]SUX33051.1 Uncharacterised protein [Chromobacterium violaceum]
MIVKAAAPGLQVPKEDSPRAYITDAEAVDVPRSAYYLRILGDGDLVEVDEAASVKTNAKKGAE